MFFSNFFNNNKQILLWKDKYNNVRSHETTCFLMKLAVVHPFQMSGTFERERTIGNE